MADAVGKSRPTLDYLPIKNGLDATVIKPKSITNSKKNGTNE